MKLTGTKKLLLIFLAIIAVGAACVGWGLSKSSSSAAAEVQERTEAVAIPDDIAAHASDDYYDDEILHAIADETEIDYELINFYAHANNANAGLMYADLQSEYEEVKEVITTFLTEYASGSLTTDADIDGEDWFIAPDDVSNYNPAYCGLGMQATWTEYYSSKSNPTPTNESQYWANTGFTIGNYDRWPMSGTNIAQGVRYIYSFAWLEEGEKYTFGFNSPKVRYATVTYGAYSNTSAFFDTLSGYWFDSSGVADATDTSRKPNGSRKTIADYKTEYSSSITPDSSFLSLYKQNSNGLGINKLTISADAPSGAYYIDCINPQNTENNLPTKFCWGSNHAGWWNWHTGGAYSSNWSSYARYVVIVKRAGITAPTVEYEDGVANDLMSKTVTFNYDYQTITLAGDWGPGLSTVTLTGGDISVVSRPTKGTGTCGNLVVKAKNIGVYTINLSPFKTWANGSTAPVTFKFEIKKKVMDIPYVVKEEGVDQATNSKFAYKIAGKQQYISLYPVPSDWLVFQTTTMSADEGNEHSFAFKDGGGNIVKDEDNKPISGNYFRWSDNGVLTFSGIDKTKHKIVVRLKDTANMQWSDGTNGKIEFTFEIGDEKVSVPGIIQDAGVDPAKLQRRVTYDGSLQLMSFMPYDSKYLSYEIEGTVVDDYEERGVLRVIAQDAGTYVINIKPKTGFIFDTESSVAITYKLIIDEAEIDMPVLTNTDRVGNTRTITYGGEKIGDTNEDWVATLNFDNCSELALSYVTSSLHQQYWGNTELILAGRYAGTYTVSFNPKKNYKWRNGVDGTLTFSLVIEPMRITIPYIMEDAPATFKDGTKETNVSYTKSGTPTKYVDFNGLEDENGNPYIHNIRFNFPTSAAASAITYIKSGSIEADFNSSQLGEYYWNGDYFIIGGTNAGRYEINIQPSANYRWDDATADGKSIKQFIFHIMASTTDALGFEVYNNNTRHWDWTDNYNRATDEDGNVVPDTFYLKRNFDGTPHLVRIGGLNPDGETNWRYSYDTLYHKYDIVDESDNPITDTLDTTPVLRDGRLQFEFVNAGTYRIRVSLLDTNFCWKESGAITVFYTVVVLPQGISDPSISQNDSVSDVDSGGDAGQRSFSAASPYTMFCVYFNVNFNLVVNLPNTFKEYITITAPDGTVYGKGTSAGYYTAWTASHITFRAKEVGDWTWTLEVADKNYSWATRDKKKFEFTIHISRAGVSGIEMHFLGNDPERSITLGHGNTLKTSTDLLGRDERDNGRITSYNDAIFNEAYQYLYIVRTNTNNLVKTGFDIQFDYALTYSPLESGYESDVANEMYCHEFNENGLKLYALNAGTYTVTITPTSNYTWKAPDNATVVIDNIDPVVLTFKINKLTIAKPLIVGDDTDATDTVINNTSGSTKTVTYNRDKQTLSIGLIGEDSNTFYTPYAYKLVSFTYLNGENDKATAESYIGYIDKNVRFSDIVCGDLYYNSVLKTVTDYKNIVDKNGNIDNIKVPYTDIYSLAAQLSGQQPETEPVDKDYSKYTVWAKSSGEYRLVIQIDNRNNYQWPAGMGADECNYYLVINQLGVDLPEAYLLDVDVDTTDPAFEETSAYLGAHGTPLDAASFYQARFEYDSLDHHVYLVGSSIADGDFGFSWKASTNNGVSPVNTVTTVTGTEYYQFTASKVNTYTISVKFVSHDYYWKDQQSAGSVAREFKLVISTKLIDVPLIQGHELEILRNNSYTINFPYLQQVEQIKILGINFGVDNGTGSPVQDNTNGRYSFINARISPANNTATTTAFDVTYDHDSGSIDMFTSRTATDAAQVPLKYCVELYLDTANLRWKTSGAGDTNSKFYYINIEKASVEVPYIEETKTTTGSTLYVTYSGEDWLGDDTYGRLVLSNVKQEFIDYTTVSDPAMIVYDTVDAEELHVTAPAPAGTYTITIKLKYPQNMEWKGMNGSVENLSFNLVVQRIKVAKPYIYVQTTEAQEGVQGWKKTVTYDKDNAQAINIANIWKDDVYPTDPRWMKVTDSSPFLTRGYTTGTSVTDGSGNTTYYKYGKSETYDGEMAYNAYNNGLYEYTAKNAGTYTVTIALTGNADWADGTRDPIDVTFVIEKYQYDTPYIEVDPSETDASYSGTQTKHYTYALNADGTAKERNMRVMLFDDNIMTYEGVIGGKKSPQDGVGYIAVANPATGYDGTYYYFTATNAGTYEVQFKIKDFENNRWKYADKETITFTLDIDRLTLDNPLVSGDYKLDNEELDSTGMTVDYDERQHTILLENIVGSFTAQADGSMLSYFLKYKETTASTSSYNFTQIRREETTEKTGGGYLTVEDLFGSKYPKASRLTELVKKENILVISATIPGTYVLTVYLADDENMQWSEGGWDPVDIILQINKVEHDAPILASNTSSSQEYAGTDVFFQIDNVINGVMEKDGELVYSVYETYELVSYVGPDTSIDQDAIDAINADIQAYLTAIQTLPASAVSGKLTSIQESWYAGRLTLKMSSIGTYNFKVSIKDPDYVAWRDTADTSKPFSFSITKRNLTGEFSFKSKDEETNAALLTGSTKWAISVPVTAVLTVKGLREDARGIIDDVLGLKLYYVKTSDTTTEINPLTYTDTPVYWTLTPQTDGTVTLVLEYAIPSGKRNISKDSYIIFAEQTPRDSNYAISQVRKTFEIVADPAPFKTNMLEWSYEWDTDASGGTYLAGADGKEFGNRLHLPYLTDGGVYTFSIGLNATGMAGFDGAGYTDLEDALNSWQVTWDTLYGGTQRVTNAGQYEVSVIIKALDPDLYAFDDYTCKLFIEIDKAKYDLTGLSWDYDGAPFEFDGTNKSVGIDGLSDPSLTGLSVQGYTTKYTFTSGANGTTSYGPYTFNDNKIAYAGEYQTTVRFTTPANSNYMTPVQGDNKTYTGTFNWSCDWTITKQMLDVEWAKGSTVSSSGEMNTYPLPKIDGTHTNKFNYKYYKKDASGNWAVVSAMTRVPGQVVDYKVEASLKYTGNPSTASTDYARNYEFNFIYLEDNPMTYTLGDDDTVIFNHIEINGKTDTQYEYTGNPFVATSIIDVDTSNGEVSESDIIVNYYSAVNPGLPISAPVEPGNYIVKLKLRYTNASMDYALSETEFDFEITRYSFKENEFSWHVKHEGDDGEFEAYYDVKQGKWINEDNEEVSLVYDGRAYTVSLVCTHPALEITMVDGAATNAGNHNSKAFFRFNTARYNAPTIKDNFDWEIEKAILDLSLMHWSYEQPFTFAVENGTPKKYTVEMLGLPAYLTDKVTYITNYNGTFVSGAVSNAGSYDTTFSINDISANTNYFLDEASWPDDVKATLYWKIERKEIELPKSDGSWLEFDGVTHNLSKIFGFDRDWEEYFTVTVKYESFDGKTVKNPYSGELDYGNRLIARDAGTYTLNFALKTVFNPAPVTNLVWLVSDGAVTEQTTTAPPVTIVVAKTAINVNGWDVNYESSTARLDGGLDANKYLEYEYYEGSSGKAGTKSNLDKVLASMGGDTFSMVPVVKEAYQGNIDLTCDVGQEFVYFTTKEINVDDLELVPRKPYIYGYTSNGAFKRFGNDDEIVAEYTGSPITFEIFDWENNYSKKVAIHDGDDLTQTDAGNYSVTLILRNDGDKPYYWGINEDGTIDRLSVKLTFSIKYKMLTIPVLPEAVTYTGSNINILSKVENEPENKNFYAQLLAQYGNYVEITGSIYQDAGTYKLYLAIKDEYVSAIRWNDGSETGKVGTLTFVWTINPLVLERPVARPASNGGVTIVYDGQEHTVYEILVGYEETDENHEALLMLMDSINSASAGFRSIDVATLAAIFALPSGNYAWATPSGDIDSNRASVTINWEITKCKIDFSKSEWGYKDDEDVFHKYEQPFQYTLKNGKPVAHSVVLGNIPEIAEFYLSYTTDTIAGSNSSSKLGPHTTGVVFNSSALNSNNYEIGEMPGDKMSFTWEIVAREFTVPDEGATNWDTFDGNIHDLMEALGFESGWENYFDVTVEYRESDQVDYSPYGGEEDQKVGFSLYNGYYFGYYKLTISIKAGLNDTEETVVWSDGTTDTKVAELHIKELEIEITGWDEDGAYSEVILDKDLELSDNIKGLLEYVIYDPVNPDKIIAPEKVVSGTTYNIEFRVKTGNDYGIVITTSPGIKNPLEFGSFDFGSQPIVWVPIPTLEESTKMFTGEELTFAIKDWNSTTSKYYLSDREKMAYKAYYGVDLGNDVHSFVFLNDVNSLKATSAGTYKVVVRLLSKVNLSWYDPSVYTVNMDNRLVVNATGKVISDEEEAQYYNRRSYTLTYEITKAPVDRFSPDDFEDFAEQFANLVLSYNASEQFINAEDGKYADLFKAITDKYGNLITFGGEVSGITARSYELIISLTDESSSYWNTGEYEQKSYIAFTIEGYELRYVKADGVWKLIFVAVDEDGEIVKDSSGKYLEYNKGDYTIDEVNYVPVYEIEYVDVTYTDNGTKTSRVDQTNYTIEQELFYGADNNWAYIDGKVVYHEYLTNDGIAILYELVDGEYKVYTIPEDPDDIEWDRLFVARYQRYDSGDNKGYKIAKTEEVDVYAPYFDYLTEDKDGYKIPLEGIYTYLVEVEGKYVLRQYSIIDGKFELDGDNKYIVLNETDYEPVVDDTLRYVIVDGEYTEDPDGVYLKAVKTQIVAAVDENGNRIVDAGNTKINVNVAVESYETFSISWKISSAIVESPSLDEENMPKYTGKEIFLKDILDHFDEKIMEITGDVSATDVGEYEAQISLKNSSSVWADTEDEFITIKWTISPVTVSLEGVTWNYTEETVYTYERAGGKAVIHKVWLDNLPSELDGKVKYTTNNTEGSNAGRDVGRYFTTFELVNLGDNFEEIIVPEDFKTSCTWYIQRKLLVIPTFIDSWVVFDNVPHNLLTFLTLPDDWNEYFELNIEYSNGGEAVSYQGYDLDKNGKIEGTERYYAYGAGTYKFYFSIIKGINTSTTPNVVWVTGHVQPDEVVEEGDDTLVTPETTEMMLLILPYRAENAVIIPDAEEYFEDEELILPPDEAEGFDGEEEGEEDGEEEEGEGEEGNEDGDGDDDIIVAPPTPARPDDPNKPDDDYLWEITRQEITMTVGKYEILVEGWIEADVSSEPILNYNPNGSYVQSLVDRIISLNVVTTSIWDMSGNKVTYEELEAGHTYFLHVEIDERYEDYIELIYADGVPKSLDFDVPDTSKTLEKVPPLDTDPYVIPFTGGEIDFRVEYLNDLLKGRNYLTIVESESDALVQSNAGTYYVTIAFTDGSAFCWDSSRPNDRSAVRLQIIVEPMQIEKITDLGSVQYTGQDIDIVAEKLSTMEGIGKYVTVANNETDYIGKNVGPYSFSIVIKDEYLNSILWEDGTNTPITVSWEITPATISGEWNERGRITFDTKNTSYVGGYDEIIKYTYTNVITGEVVTTLVTGETYEVFAELNDSVNLQLGDTINPETKLSENPYTFTLTVELITLKRPVLTNSALEYTGSPITFGILIDGKDISEYSEYVEIVAELSDSLTQTNYKEGGFKVVVRLKNGASWDDYGTDDWTATFEIAKAVLSGVWNEDSGTLTLNNNYPGSFLKYEYSYWDDDAGEYKPISRAHMEVGKTYKVTAVLTDENNFVWAEGQQLELIFTLNVEFEILAKPTHSMGTLTYTGDRQNFVIDEWSHYSQFVELAQGSANLYGINAGTYTVILKIKDGASAVWEDGSDTGEVIFIIDKATLDGEWGNDGKVKVTTEGNFDADIAYIYTDANGETKTYEELQEGETYTAQAIPSSNVEFNFESTKTFTFAKPVIGGDEGGSKFPWWIFLIIGLLLLIIIIIIIIIIWRRRKDDDEEYDDDSEYYGDEYNEGDDEYYGDEEDYGDYGDAGSEG